MPSAHALFADRTRHFTQGQRSPEIAPDLWPIALFLAVMLTIGIKRYRQTLD